MIEIKNISKTFKNNKVLDGIDLTINQGDVVARSSDLLEHENLHF